jgi:hypothetical protein
MAYHPKSLATYPDHIRDMLPFTWVAGVGPVSKEVYDLTQYTHSKFGGQACRDLIKHLNMSTYYRENLVYTAHCSTEVQYAKVDSQKKITGKSITGIGVCLVHFYT